LDRDRFLALRAARSAVQGTERAVGQFDFIVDSVELGEPYRDYYDERRKNVGAFYGTSM